MSVSHAATLANLPANSFPCIPMWALTHEKSYVHFKLSKVDTLFLISCMRWAWLLVFFNESSVILLLVYIVAVRRLSSELLKILLLLGLLQ